MKILVTDWSNISRPRIADDSDDGFVFAAAQVSLLASIAGLVDCWMRLDAARPLAPPLFMGSEAQICALQALLPKRDGVGVVVVEVRDA